jgi:EAL and modified HD-GYP domain-containing signal transduction protein
MLDAMLDQSIHTVLGKMPLSEQINAALIDKTGRLFPFFRLVETYEKGNWVGFRFAVKKTGIAEEKIADFYLEAVSWADSYQVL